MNWTKLGLIQKPDSNINWMSHYVGPSFVDLVGDKLILYITGRDKNNISRIGTSELIQDSDGNFRVINVSQKPIFDIGMLGTFDESGVSYPWIIKHNNKIYMYYVGWVAGGLNRFFNFTGLAISEDEGKTFLRAKNIPILDRTEMEPFGTGSCCVYIEDNLWKMYYTAFEPWEYFEGKNKPRYNIKFAHSEDGIHWIRNQEVIIDFKDKSEHVIGKPMLLKEEGVYKLWYSYRGNSYRIGYAESIDGKKYTRLDHKVGIDVSSSGWDSQMIEYGFVFDYRKKKYMIYNGNDFGKTGLGIACLQY